VYVKEPYRRGGIARGLFAAAGVDPRERFFYTCKTGIGAELARSKASRAEWRPLIARYRRRDEELTPRGAP
jgi:hypothetical protein